jgi:hydrogenase nickel incorporation protein HypA/HybF
MRMHELSIALSIVDGVAEELESRGAPKLHAVHVRIGRFSGVAKEALLFCYEQACQGTPLQGSRLMVAEDGGDQMLITALEIEQ